MSFLILLLSDKLLQMFKDEAPKKLHHELWKDFQSSRRLNVRRPWTDRITSDITGSPRMIWQKQKDVKGDSGERTGYPNHFQRSKERGRQGTANSQPDGNEHRIDAE